MLKADKWELIRKRVTKKFGWLKIRVKNNRTNYFSLRLEHVVLEQAHHLGETFLYKNGTEKTN